MCAQRVYVAAADTEEHLADALAGPLTEAGYEVIHNGTVEVGRSVVEMATAAIKQRAPVVLCATTSAVGSQWVHKIVNASHKSGPPRVFVVQMDAEAYVDQLGIDTVVARYYEDEVKALRDLLAALSTRFPPFPSVTEEPRPSLAAGGLHHQFLDEPSGIVQFDFTLLQSFRDDLREEVLAVYPHALSPHQFLVKCGLWVSDCLTRTGVLLLAAFPSPREASFTVKCTQYFGANRSASREGLTFEGGVRSQIARAVEFVADRTRLGERPSSQSARTEAFHAYPMIAVREIIANAVVHRDYTRDDASVHVRLFSDRLEVVSPGTWQGQSLEPGTPRDLEDLEGESVKRNFQLARLLAWTRYVEGEGSGIPTAVEDCRSLGAAQPTVVQKNGFVTVRLHHRPRVPAGLARYGDKYARRTQPASIGVLPIRAANLQKRARLLGPDSLADGTTILFGLGGVGKTQLAADIAASRFSAGDLDLLVWVEAGNREAVLARFAQAAVEVLGADGADPTAAADMFLVWLRSSARESPAPRWLVVLDDVADPAELAGLWPPHSPHGSTIVTTRRRDAALLSGRRTVDIGVFTPAESVAYLGAALAARRQPDPAEQLAGLAEDLGHLPLALSQVVAYVLDAGITCSRYRQLLADRSRNLADVLPPREMLPDAQHHTIAAVWALSVEQADRLRPVGLARPMLQLAAMLGSEGIPAAVLTGLPALAHLTANRDAGGSADEPAEVTAEEATQALRSLHRLSLVDHSPYAPVRAVRVHQLVQRATRDTLTSEQVARLSRIAANALLTAWPSIERDTDLAGALRASTFALTEVSGDALFRPGVHEVLHRVGRSLGESGQFDAALDHFRRLNALAARHFGPDDPNTLAVRQDLALWRGRAGDAEGAADAYGDLLAAMRRVLGPDHPSTLTTRHNLALFRSEAGDVAGAAEEYAALLADRFRVLGPDHPDTLTTRHNLASSRGRAGDAAGAAEVFGELLAAMRRVLGPDHPSTLTTRHELASWRGEAGDVAGAAEEYAALLADRIRVLGPDHPHTLTTRHNLASWQGEAGDAAGAAEAYSALLTDRVRVLGPEHPDTLITRHNLASWRGRAGDTARAAAEFGDLLAVVKRILGPDHPATLASESELAVLSGQM